jgi:hypothetical protein
MQGFAREKETNTERDNHQQVARKVVPVDESPRDGGDQSRTIQVKNMAMAGEEFEHPVEGFYNPD